jgi:hypothetical protein
MFTVSLNNVFNGILPTIQLAIKKQHSASNHSTWLQESTRIVSIFYSLGDAKKLINVCRASNTINTVALERVSLLVLTSSLRTSIPGSW